MKKSIIFFVNCYIYSGLLQLGSLIRLALQVNGICIDYKVMMTVDASYSM